MSVIESMPVKQRLALAEDKIMELEKHVAVLLHVNDDNVLMKKGYTLSIDELEVLVTTLKASQGTWHANKELDRLCAMIECSSGVMLLSGRE
jgi:hypothetical protein